LGTEGPRSFIEPFRAIQGLAGPMGSRVGGVVGRGGITSKNNLGIH